MKPFLLMLLLSPLAALSQERGPEFLEEMRERSRADLQEIIGNEVDNMEPFSAEVKNGKMYVIWGYHRGFHTRSDITFKTPDGTFTMHDVKATDRPSSGVLTYVNPADITKPQYNVRFGYMISDKVAIEVGTDHMKWVIDLSESYKITGNYHRPFWIGGQAFTLDELKDAGFNPPLWLEHTDGYNYSNVGVVYYQNLFKSVNKRWSADFGLGAGAGALVTKTNIYIADGVDGSVRHNDNNYKIAGYGLHADSRFRISYNTRSGKQIYLLGTARGVYGKVEAAPFLDNYGGRIEHSGIYSLQTGIMGGVTFPVFDGKKKKNKRRN
jgi:hypothetical protein